MSKLQIKNITPFDATYPYEVEFSWTGDMAYKNRLVIYDNDTLKQVYDETITTFYLKHTIPANTLVNGKKYLAQAQVFNKNDEPSVISDKILFNTLKTPIFRFDNVEDGQMVTSSSLTTTIQYEQEDYESIGNYKFFLYDSLKQLLMESESFSYRENISFTYRGLENTTVYYIRCSGTTVSGMPIDTGYVRIVVKFENPSKYSKIYATCYPNNGYIRYETNVKVIQYDGENEYTFDDSFIDLIGKSIDYTNGFLIQNDFALAIRGKRLYQAATIFQASNGSFSITLKSFIYDEGILRFKLEVANASSKYVLYSDPLSFDESNLVTLWILRSNNVYDLKVFVDYNYNENKTMWFGQSRPSNPERYDYWIDVDNEISQRIDKNNVTIYMDEKEPDNPVLYALWLGGD